MRGLSSSPALNASSLFFPLQNPNKESAKQPVPGLQKSSLRCNRRCSARGEQSRRMQQPPRVTLRGSWGPSTCRRPAKAHPPLKALLALPGLCSPGAKYPKRHCLSR